MLDGAFMALPNPQGDVLQGDFFRSPAASTDAVGFGDQVFSVRGDGQKFNFHF